MKSILVIFITILLVLAGRVLAQDSATVTLRGTVLDANGYPVEFATVSLADTVCKAGAITDAKGAFTMRIPQGQQTIHVQCLGYEELDIPTEITGDTSLPQVFLKPSSKAIDAVVVNAKRPLVTRTVDRVILDARSLAKLGGTAIDLLRHTPGLRVSLDGGVEMVGKGQLIVLVNGRKLQMNGAELAAYLRNLQASEVETIEVMETPPAKYSAEGNAGVINIVERKHLSDYLGGSVQDQHYVDYVQMNEPYLTLKAKLGKLLLYSKVSGGLGWREYHTETTRRFAGQEWATSQKKQVDNRYLDTKVGADYDITETLSVGAYYAFLKFIPNEEIDDASIFTTPGGTGKYSGHNSASYDVVRHNANLHLTKAFAGGRALSLEADYLLYTLQHRGLYSAQGASGYRFDNSLNRKIPTYSARVDFESPVGERVKLEAGASYVYTQTQDSADYRSRPALPDQRDRFRYTEGVAALYADATVFLHSKLALKLGLRDEFTTTHGVQSGDRRDEFNRSYNNLFPTVYLRYAPADRHVFALSSSTRIGRPSFVSVNPFSYYNDAYSVWVGNPQLRPSLSYNTSLTYTYSNNLTTSFSYRYVGNSIVRFGITDPATSVTTSIWRNAATTQAFILQASYTWNPAFWFEGQLSPVVYYLSSQGKRPELRSYVGGWSYFVGGTATFYFMRSQLLAAEVEASESGAERYANTEGTRRFTLNAELVCRLFNRRLRLSAGVTNLTAADRISTEIARNGNTITTTLRQPRTFNFAVTYHFGGAVRRAGMYNSMNSETVNRLSN